MNLRASKSNGMTDYVTVRPGLLVLLVRITESWLGGRPTRWGLRPLEDTLIGLANYAVLAILALHNKE